MVDSLNFDIINQYIHALFPDTVMFFDKDDCISPKAAPKLERAKRTTCDLCSVSSYTSNKICSVEDKNIKEFSLCYICFDKIETNIKSRQYSRTMYNKYAVTLAMKSK